MDSQTNSFEDTTRDVTAGVDASAIALGLPARAPRSWEDPPEWEYWEGLDEIQDDFELDLWEEDFRQGSAAISLCGGCGRPTSTHLSLGEWAEHPAVCKWCLTDTY